MRHSILKKVPAKIFFKFFKIFYFFKNYFFIFYFFKNYFLFFIFYFLFFKNIFIFGHFEHHGSHMADHGRSGLEGRQMAVRWPSEGRQGSPEVRFPGFGPILDHFGHLPDPSFFTFLSCTQRILNIFGPKSVQNRPSEVP